MQHNDRTAFLTYFLGIFVFYFIYGVIQEKITRGKYGSSEGPGERFTFTLSLVFVQCICNWLFAKGKFMCSKIDKRKQII